MYYTSIYATQHIYSVKNTVAVTADVVSVESKAKINIGFNGFDVALPSFSLSSVVDLLVFP